MWGSIPYSVARYIGSNTVVVLHKTCMQRSAVTLSYQIYGDDLKYDQYHHPIFLVHNLLGSKKDWSITGKILNDITKRPVVAVDLRNHGSSPHASTHKYTEMAEDLLALFEKMELKRASLVGFSMGGRVSMSLALMRVPDGQPEKVARMLVVDISPVSSCSHLLNVMPSIMATMKGMDFKGIKKIKDAKQEVQKKLRHLVADDNEINSILENLGILKTTGTIGWICNLDVLINNFDYIKDFPSSLLSKSYQGPTLFVGGQHSEYIPPDDLPLIRELFPRAVIKYIPKTGHNLQTEDPKRFLELATHFLKSTN